LKSGKDPGQYGLKPKRDHNQGGENEMGRADHRKSVSTIGTVKGNTLWIFEIGSDRSAKQAT
jgi:hypothetical protein